jgi:beta-1,4-mannooligosaccharide/beta-1,4-mannosyl-N-acetylglucosamine phosphorylase
VHDESCVPARRPDETGRVAVYYGCADTVTGLAFGYIPEIIDFTKRTNICR